LDQTKDYKIGIRCFSSKHSALRRKSKDWLTRIQGNVFECGERASKNVNPTKGVGLVQSEPHHHLIETEKLLSWH